MPSPTATLDAQGTPAVEAGATQAAATLPEKLRGIALELAETLPPRQLYALGDDDLLLTTGAIEHLGRYVDALRVEAAAEIEHRSQGVIPKSEGLAARKGCRNAVELLERVTRVAGTTAHKRIKLGKETKRSGFDLTFPARFPVIADAFEAGLLGVDAANSILAGILPALSHCSIDGLKAAEESLVSVAIGTSDLVPTACTADEVRQQAMVWQAYLDPDGAEPVERRAWRKRGFEAGVLCDGLVRGRYALLPEIAAKLGRLFDAYLSPKTDTPPSEAPQFRTAEEHAETDLTTDKRSRDQQRHDILAAMIDHYARSDQPPTIGGAAPTVLVTVRAEDLAAGHGRGHIDGTTAPLTMRSIRHLACNGGYQTLTLDINGSIHGLSSPQRCYTATQRRAITARDGGCIIPGCTIPAAWCEIHHVDPAENGGPTHTDNGVLLCWFHHRSLDTSDWEIRMHNGNPYIKAPPWINPHAGWRPATKSPTTTLTSIEARAESHTQRN